ncbi:hypothetical protein D3C71_1845450 [compost metagenome]
MFTRGDGVVEGSHRTIEENGLRANRSQVRLQRVQFGFELRGRNSSVNVVGTAHHPDEVRILRCHVCTESGDEIRDLVARYSLIYKRSLRKPLLEALHHEPVGEPTVPKEDMLASIQ